MTATVVQSGLCSACLVRPANWWVDGQERALCLACLGLYLEQADQEVRSWRVDRLLHELWHRRAPKVGCRWCLS